MVQPVESHQTVRFKFTFLKRSEYVLSKWNQTKTSIQRCENVFVLAG